jgi:hypothetical protein
MLSKMAKPKDKTLIESCNEIVKKDLNKSKLPELKQFARELNIKISGNKPALILRIEECLVQTRNVVKIQRNARKYLVAKWFRMKGSRAGCVNETDFYTLEPLSEIHYLYYFQHTENGHSYGFNLKSLCQLAIKNSKFQNPYNRESMKSAEQKIADVVKLTNIIFPNNELMRDILAMNDGAAMQSTIIGLIQDRRSPVINRLAHKLRILDRQTIDQRVVGLCMHMDSLGNYTQTTWLTELTNQRIYYMISKIHHLWMEVPTDLRKRVCPFMSPFSESVFGTEPLTPNGMHLGLLLRMAEVLVYSGNDTEHQNLGAMYFLSGLTFVSLGARAQLPWLYDNYFTIVR